MKWFSIDVPARWTDVFVRSVNVAVVAFVVLQIEEWLETRGFDTPASALDAALVAGGLLVFNALVKWARS